MTRLVILSTESALEYFRVALSEAMERERISISPFTEYYVVNLLVSQIRDGIDPNDTLADRYVEACTAARAEQVRLLRKVGDTALVSCGLWADRELRPRHAMDVGYHIAMGSAAYGRLGRMNDQLQAFGPEVFAELADRFTDLADALIRLGTERSLSTARDVLRLYEQWLKTGSRHAARALAEQGITPVASTQGEVS